MVYLIMDKHPVLLYNSYCSILQFIYVKDKYDQTSNHSKSLGSVLATSVEKLLANTTIQNNQVL